MSVVYLALPVALVLGTIAVITFVIQVRNGQFDDLDTPPRRMLFDDVETRRGTDKKLSGEPEDPESGAGTGG